jgi:two-component system sensor histidine kinase UhpB
MGIVTVLSGLWPDLSQWRAPAMGRESFPESRLSRVTAYHGLMKPQTLHAIRGDSLWRDLLLAVALAMAAGMLAAQVELSELLFEHTRQWESLQLDEWPTALLVFATVMVVLYSRRHAQLRRALVENRYLTGRIIDVQEQERRRLARELHDELGQTLNAIKLDALALPQSPTAQRIVGNADRVYRTAAGLVRNLRPPALDELGLTAALEACVARWRDSYPELEVQLSVGGRLEDLGETMNLALYRIVQEALTNCVRHSGAGHFYIDLTRAPDQQANLLLEMRDDGRGFTTGTQGAGGGLTGMRERVALLGGRFELLSEPGQGVTIRVEIPVAEP